MWLRPITQVFIQGLHAMYNFCIQAPWSDTEFFGELNPAVVESLNVATDQDLGIVYAEPMNVWHDNIIADSEIRPGVPSMYVTVMKTPDTETIPPVVQVETRQMCFDSQDYKEVLAWNKGDIDDSWVQISQTDTHSAQIGGWPKRPTEEAPMQGGAQGVQFRMAKSISTALPEMDTTSQMVATWRIGDLEDVNYCEYRVLYTLGWGRIEIKQKDAVDWTIHTIFGLEPTKQEQGKWCARGNVNVLFLNGIVRVDVDGQVFDIKHMQMNGEDVLAVDESVRVITYAKIRADVFEFFHGSMHPMKFRQTGWIKTREKQIGFEPDVSTPMHYKLRGGYIDDGDGNPVVGNWAAAKDVAYSFLWPAGSTVTCHDEAAVPTLAQAKLTIANTETSTYRGESYSDYTAIVMSVSSFIDEMDVQYGGDPVQVPWRHVRVSSHFDPMDLSIRRTCMIEVDAWKAETRAGLHPWVGEQMSHRGGIIKMGFDNPDVPPTVRFAGIIGTRFVWRRGPNWSVLTIFGEDRGKMLRETMAMVALYLDGWNHFYAMSYLAKLAGISDLAFTDYVPDDPWSIAPGTPFEDEWRLPCGSGSAPLMRVAPGTPIWSVMSGIRRKTGYAMHMSADDQWHGVHGQDQIDRLQYYKWNPTVVPATSRDFLQNTDDARRAVWNLQAHRTSDDTRNRISVIGIDAYGAWDPIIAHAEDAASITSEPGSEPVNFIGYRKDFVWMDSMFAKLDFATDVKDRLAAWMFAPGIYWEASAHGQPDIRPLDVVTIAGGDADRWGLMDWKFYVLGITDEARPGVLTSQLTCRAIPGTNMP